MKESIIEELTNFIISSNKKEVERQELENRVLTALTKDFNKSNRLKEEVKK